MNTSKLKTYAPAARRDFIRAVTDRAHLLGLSEKGATTMEVKGDVVLIGGRPYPAKVAAQREGLEARIRLSSFGHVMEAAAYTWFNRFAALRFMELHGYLEHGYRVLSHPQGSAIPEILEQAANIELPGLERETVVALKLDGNKDAELYRLLLVAQCNALSKAMPFLFERIDDETELLLPDNLLHSDSLIRKLVTEIEEESWQQVEIIGWLYQFYISEKKNQVIGKVVQSEDIPAATQLFTPNWIVKYMVQNSLGAQWLATYPQSPLKAQMEYYIEPAEQTEGVKAQLAAITPSQLNPEELTLIDPASGSGHILVEAYELFKAIYLERGYRQRDVAQLILEKNLFGLDIDERAAQLTGFALMMKGRADDRRLFERGVKLNVMALVNSAGFDVEGMAKLIKLADYGLQPGELSELARLFEYATTFGSLIQVPEGLAEKLPALKQLGEATSPDLFVSDALKRLGPLVQQAEMLAAQYDAVATNPPYLSDKHFTRQLKNKAKSDFPESRHNLYSLFLDRAAGMLRPNGHVGMVTLHSWMSGSKYQLFRERIIGEYPICAMAHLGSGAFESIGGQVVSATTFVVCNLSLADYRGVYLNLTTTSGEQAKATLARNAANDAHSPFRYVASGTAFSKVPGSPIVYWISSQELHAFLSLESLGAIADFRQGMATTDNGRFLRRWSELSIGEVAMGSSCASDRSAREKHWFPYNKGGGDRRWYGHNDFIVRYENGGAVLIELVRQKYPRISDPEFVIKNRSYYFKPSVTYSALSDGEFAARICGRGFIFDTKGSCAFPKGGVSREEIASLLNSCVASSFLRLLAPTLDFSLFALKSIPVTKALPKGIETLARRCMSCAEADWNAYERSWDFQSLPIVTLCSDPTPTLESSYTAWISQNRDTIAEMKLLEEENNRLFIDAYGLQEELTPDVPIEQITLTLNPAYRYGGKLTEEEQWIRFRQDTMEELVSYAVGCMMGRYSLDAPGLIYAHSGNEGFEASRYPTFPADDDGIIPLTDFEWFGDDAANRLVQFISVAWDKRHLEENLRFLADNLSPKKGETSRETLRRYLCDSFFKNHLQTYKNRPIYWMFSSGKQKAFQCLVYLHRYNEGTLARMRTEYVTPLQGKLFARVSNLQEEIAAAPSTAARNRLQKQLDIAKKKQAELAAFDDLLRHYADQRIHLDLDDGVKVNYGKFGTLLAEVKTVTGGTSDD